jgi:hypothetical protein
VDALDTLIARWRGIEFDPTRVMTDPAAYEASFERGRVEIQIDDHLAALPREQVEGAIARIEAALGDHARWPRYRDSLDRILVVDDARIRLVDNITLDHHRWTEAHNAGLARCAPWLRRLSLYEMTPSGIERVLRDVPFPALQELTLEALHLDCSSIRAAIASWRRRIAKVRVSEG